jgi:hypothetical protein
VVVVTTVALTPNEVALPPRVRCDEARGLLVERREGVVVGFDVGPLELTTAEAAAARLAATATAWAVETGVSRRSMREASTVAVGRPSSDTGQCADSAWAQNSDSSVQKACIPRPSRLASSPRRTGGTRCRVAIATRAA